MTCGDAILAVCDEHVELAAAALSVLSLMDDATDWYGQLCAAALVWQPFVDRGLSIPAWLSLVAEAL